MTCLTALSIAVSTSDQYTTFGRYQPSARAWVMASKVCFWSEGTWASASLRTDGQEFFATNVVCASFDSRNWARAMAASFSFPLTPFGMPSTSPPMTWAARTGPFQPAYTSNLLRMPVLDSSPVVNGQLVANQDVSPRR